MKLWFTLPMVVGATLVAGATARPELSSEAAASATPVTTATVSGRVLIDSMAEGSVAFEGEKPEVKPLVIDESKSEGCVHGGGHMDKTDRSMLIGEGGGIANVVVSVDVKGAKVEAPKDPIQMDQKSCRFEPHVMVVPVGTTVEFLNSDTISHNVHTYAGKNDSMNKIIAPNAKETQVLEKADRIEIKCDVHPWMNSWLVVADTPYTAVTGPDGSFQIPGLPAGTHKVEYWHEKLGKGKGEITVAEDGTAAKVEFKMGAAKKKGRRR